MLPYYTKCLSSGVGGCVNDECGHFSGRHSTGIWKLDMIYIMLEMSRLTPQKDTIGHGNCLEARMLTLERSIAISTYLNDDDSTRCCWFRLSIVGSFLLHSYGKSFDGSTLVASYLKDVG